eukprot:TRINITY_DN50882_c0_g2_i1.p1 TRINITY_DN50882_c0_g2~~TRINITY_DN50882_c0_g2_i1.p1  ORF type:complete len:510 (-),score=56.82 TRINITY_DN50882_c0_g2_i1:93-1622(-)
MTLLTVFVLALGLVGCGGSDGDSNYDKLVNAVASYKTAATSAQTVLNSTDSNYDALTAAITAAETQAANVTTALTAEDLTDEQKAQVQTDITTAESALNEVKASKAGIDAVIAAIADLGTITLDKKAAVEAARTAYNALPSDGEKAKVNNYAVLTAAEAALGEAGAITTIAAIAAIEIQAGADIAAALPTTVGVTYADASTDTLAITWDTTGFNNTTVGTTTIGGIIVNPNTNENVAVTIDVTVTADTTAPVITLNGNATVYLTVGAIYVEAGATAEDAVDGPITVATPAGIDAIDTTTDGSFTLTYSAVDAAGNQAEATRTVVVDGTAPVITLVGEATVTLTVGDTYTEAGVTANEDIRRPINKVGEVDTTTAGTYTITYTAIDMAGNVSAPISRTVVVNPVAGDLVTMAVERKTDPNDGDYIFNGMAGYEFWYALTLTLADEVEGIVIYSGTRDPLATPIAVTGTYTKDPYKLSTTATQNVTIEVYGAGDELLDTVTLPLQLSLIHI